MIRRAALLLAIFANPAFADGDIPLACNPQQDPAVCQIKVQRNDALDREANAVGAIRIMRREEAVLANWWSDYVKGLETCGKDK